MVHIKRSRAEQDLVLLTKDRIKFLHKCDDSGVIQHLLLIGCTGFVNMTNEQLARELRKLHYVRFEQAVGDERGETSMAEYCVVDNNWEPPVTGTDNRDYDIERKDKELFTKK